MAYRGLEVGHEGRGQGGRRHRRRQRHGPRGRAGAAAARGQGGMRGHQRGGARRDGDARRHGRADRRVHAERRGSGGRGSPAGVRRREARGRGRPHQLRRDHPAVREAGRPRLHGDRPRLRRQLARHAVHDQDVPAGAAGAAGGPHRQRLEHGRVHPGAGPDDLRRVQSGRQADDRGPQLGVRTNECAGHGRVPGSRRHEHRAELRGPDLDGRNGRGQAEADDLPGRQGRQGHPGRDGEGRIPGHRGQRRAVPGPVLPAEPEARGEVHREQDERPAPDEGTGPGTCGAGISVSSPRGRA